jgi:O-antigen ligase
MNDSETGVYIGPMPDGTFRVMLINFILFPIMLCYYNWKKTNFAWSAFYMVAIFATGTRAFLLAGALILGVSLIRKRPLLGISAAAAVALAALIYVGDLQRLRVFELSSELTSTSARYLQFFSLTELFWEHPIFGAGFGASAVVIRSHRVAL